MNMDLSMNFIDISNIQIYLDISNNERIVSEITNGHESICNIVNETTNLLDDAKETFLDISNNPQHILNVKEEFLAVDLIDQLLQMSDKKYNKKV
jgi:hypothetical protein